MPGKIFLRWSKGLDEGEDSCKSYNFLRFDPISFEFLQSLQFSDVCIMQQLGAVNSQELHSNALTVCRFIHLSGFPRRMVFRRRVLHLQALTLLPRARALADGSHGVGPKLYRLSRMMISNGSTSCAYTGAKAKATILNRSLTRSCDDGQEILKDKEESAHSQRMKQMITSGGMLRKCSGSSWNKVNKIEYQPPDFPANRPMAKYRTADFRGFG